jgi:hypothetical protein
MLLRAVPYILLHVVDQDRQNHFTRLVGMADRLFAETQNENAAIDIFRAALQICPNCKTGSVSGHLSERVFEFEEFAGAEFFYSTLQIPFLATCMRASMRPVDQEIKIL